LWRRPRPKLGCGAEERKKAFHFQADKLKYSFPNLEKEKLVYF
jgi:hypothetical protein